MEFEEDLQKEILALIKRCSESPNGLDLSNREMAMLYHWIRNVNEPMYSFVPEEYKKELPNYNGGQK